MDSGPGAARLKHFVCRVGRLAALLAVTLLEVNERRLATGGGIRVVPRKCLRP